MWNAPGSPPGTGPGPSPIISATASHGHPHDTVLSEFPVFVSNSLSQSLYLVQYPLCPRTTSSDDQTLLKAQYKNTQEKLELTYGINTDIRYDKRKGKLYKKDMKSAGKEEINVSSDSDSEDENSYMQEQTLESSLIPKYPNPPIYVVAIVKNGQLHLTPIKNILQMKPTFPHVNASDVRRKENKENQMEIDDDAEEPEASKVTVKFSKTRDIGNKKPSTASLHKHHNTFQKKLDAEPWIPLEPIKEGEAKQSIYNKLISNNTGSKIDEVGALESKSYCNLLFPKSNDKLVIDLNYKISE